MISEESNAVMIYDRQLNKQIKQHKYGKCTCLLIDEKEIVTGATQGIIKYNKHNFEEVFKQMTKSYVSSLMKLNND